MTSGTSFASLFFISALLFPRAICALKVNCTQLEATNVLPLTNYCACRTDEKFDANDELLWSFVNGTVIGYCTGTQSCSTEYLSVSETIFRYKQNTTTTEDMEYECSVMRQNHSVITVTTAFTDPGEAMLRHDVNIVPWKLVRMSENKRIWTGKVNLADIVTRKKESSVLQQSLKRRCLNTGSKNCAAQVTIYLTTEVENGTNDCNMTEFFRKRTCKLLISHVSYQCSFHKDMLQSSTPAFTSLCNNDESWTPQDHETSSSVRVEYTGTPRVISTANSATLLSSTEAKAVLHNINIDKNKGRYHFIELRTLSVIVTVVVLALLFSVARQQLKKCNCHLPGHFETNQYQRRSHGLNPRSTSDLTLLIDDDRQVSLETVSDRERNITNAQFDVHYFRLDPLPPVPDGNTQLVETGERDEVTVEDAALELSTMNRSETEERRDIEATSMNHVPGGNMNEEDDNFIYCVIDNREMETLSFPSDDTSTSSSPPPVSSPSLVSQQFSLNIPNSETLTTVVSPNTSPTERNVYDRLARPVFAPRQTSFEDTNSHQYSHL